MLEIRVTFIKKINKETEEMHTKVNKMKFKVVKHKADVYAEEVIFKRFEVSLSLYPKIRSSKPNSLVPLLVLFTTTQFYLIKTNDKLLSQTDG